LNQESNGFGLTARFNVESPNPLQVAVPLCDQEFEGFPLVHWIFWETLFFSFLNCLTSPQSNWEEFILRELNQNLAKY